MYQARVTEFAAPGVEGEIRNTVTASSGGLATPLTATATTAARLEPELTISKALSPAVVTGNGPLTYTFTIRNTSNGSLIDRDWLDFFRHEPPFRFNITLYGGSEETYERLCGRPMFGRVTENIRALRQLGIGVKLNASMTPYNVADMEAMQYSSLPPVTPRISRTWSFI